jgi:hypothetical protein
MPVGADHAGSDTPGNLRRGATDTAGGANQLSPARSPATSRPRQAAM